MKVGALMEGLRVALVVGTITFVLAFFLPPTEQEEVQGQPLGVVVDGPVLVLGGSIVEEYAATLMYAPAVADQRSMIATQDTECVERRRRANAEFLGLPCDAMGDCCSSPEDCYFQEWCPYVKFTFLTDVGVTMNEDGNVVVEIVQ